MAEKGTSIKAQQAVHVTGTYHHTLPCAYRGVLAKFGKDAVMRPTGRGPM